MHGIQREQLVDGIAPADALTKANEIIGAHIAFCDGGEHDLRWLLHLVQAAGTYPTFRLANWAVLGGSLSKEQQSRMVQRLRTEQALHRAGADAERLMQALADALGGPSRPE